MSSWNIPWPTLEYSLVLTQTEPQFTFNSFYALYKDLSAEMVRTTEYHLQASGQVERFQATLISRQRNYVAEHQKGWDTFPFPLTYAYHCQVHQTTKLPLFSVEITLLLLGSTAVARPILQTSARSTHLLPIDFTSSTDRWY